MNTVFDPNKPCCVECGNEFTPVRRPQGGGTYRIYCSAKCRANSWARKNTQKRKLSVLKFDSKSESKEKKRERTRQVRFSKYKLTEFDVVKMLTEQKYQCAGCGIELDLNSGRVDHSHTTNKVRGILCDHCNWSLGHARDNPNTLRRLADYLDQN